MAPTKKPKSLARKMGIARRKKEAKARKKQARVMEAVEEDVEVPVEIELHPNAERGMDDNVMEPAWYIMFDTHEVNHVEEESWDDIFFPMEGDHMEEESVLICIDVNEGDNTEDRDKVCQEVDDILHDYMDGYIIDDEIVEFCPDVNYGYNTEDREQECQEVVETLQENKEGNNMEEENVEICLDDEDGEQESFDENEEYVERDKEDEPIDGVDYYQLCLDHFNPDRINELLVDDRYLLHWLHKPHSLQSCKGIHIWLRRFFKAVKAAGAKEDETKEWSDGMVDNEPEALIGTISLSSTADDAALIPKVVSKYEHVIVRYCGEKERIDMRILHSKQKGEIIDDPDDSLYIVDDEEDDGDNVDVDVANDDVEVVVDDDDDDIIYIVDVGTISPFDLVADDFELMDEVITVLSESSGWNLVQGVPYRTYTNGLYEMFTDLKTYKYLIDEFLLRLGGIFGVTRVDDIHNFVTFLSS